MDNADVSTQSSKPLRRFKLQEAAAKALPSFDALSLEDGTEGAKAIDVLIIATLMDVALNDSEGETRRKAARDLSDLRGLATKADVRAGKYAAVVQPNRERLLITDKDTFKELFQGLSTIGFEARAEIDVAASAVVVPTDVLTGVQDAVTRPN